MTDDNSATKNAIAEKCCCRPQQIIPRSTVVFDVVVFLCSKTRNTHHGDCLLFETKRIVGMISNLDEKLKYGSGRRANKPRKKVFFRLVSHHSFFPRSKTQMTATKSYYRG